MTIDSSMPVSPFTPVENIHNQTNKTNQTTGDAHEAFSSVLQSAIEGVNNEQLKSQEMTEQLITGEVDNLHDVMIASEKAGIALQTTIEVRNKAIEAYETMMRMQV